MGLMGSEGALCSWLAGFSCPKLPNPPNPPPSWDVANLVPVVAGIQWDTVPPLVQHPLVVARTLAQWHTGVVVKEEPVVAVAALVAVGGTLHARAPVQAEARAGSPSLLALLGCLVHHVAWAQCWEQERQRGRVRQEQAASQPLLWPVAVQGISPPP